MLFISILVGLNFCTQGINFRKMSGKDEFYMSELIAEKLGVAIRTKNPICKYILRYSMSKTWKVLQKNRF